MLNVYLKSELLYCMENAPFPFNRLLPVQIYTKHVLGHLEALNKLAQKRVT